MKNIAYLVVDEKGDRTEFERESQARLYAQTVAEGGHAAYILKVVTSHLTSYFPSEVTR